jgi:hypothetical protein
MSFLEFIEDSDSATAAAVPPSAAVVKGSVVPAVQATGHLVKPSEAPLTKEEIINGQLRELENEILVQNLEQIQHAQAWPEVAPELDPKDDSLIPEDWVKKHGPKKAKEKYRVARAALLPNKEAPVGLSQAVKVATGIIKARANEKSGPKILNLNLVEMPQVIIQYPETEVKK